MFWPNASASPGTCGSSCGSRLAIWTSACAAASLLSSTACSKNEKSISSAASVTGSTAGAAASRGSSGVSAAGTVRSKATSSVACTGSPDNGIGSVFRSGRSKTAGATSTAAGTTGATGTTGAAGANANGTRRPSERMASAEALNTLGSHPPAVPAEMSFTQRPKAFRLSCASVSRSGCTGFCSANQALNICSIDHAASPNSLSPTMRELPLSVWNARRNVVCSLRSAGVRCRTSIAAVPLPITSRASSRKICSSSSSSSPGAGMGADTGG